MVRLPRALLVVAPLLVACGALVDESSDGGPPDAMVADSRHDAATVDGRDDVGADTAACARGRPRCDPGQNANALFEEVLSRCGFVRPSTGCFDVYAILDDRCVVEFGVSEVSPAIADCVVRDLTDSYWPCADAGPTSLVLHVLTPSCE